jgi:hypothetical protein
MVRRAHYSGPEGVVSQFEDMSVYSINPRSNDNQDFAKALAVRALIADEVKKKRLALLKKKHQDRKKSHRA